MNDFLEYLETQSGQPISRCFQCKKCSGGCPVTPNTEIKAHQVVRLGQLGRQDELLKSPGLWFCIGCKTCQARCPNGIDISAVIDVVRSQALKSGHLPAASIPAFHQSFLASVKRHGKVYELGMVMGYKLRVKNWLEDKDLGIRMFKKGKLSLLPHRVKNRRQVKELFELHKARSGTNG